MGPMIPQRFAHNYRTEFATHDWHRKGRGTKKWKEREEMVERKAKEVKDRNSGRKKEI